MGHPVPDEAPSMPGSGAGEDQEQEQDRSDSQPLELKLSEPDEPVESPEHFEARRLWTLQEELRAREVPKARALKATPDRLDRVLERLAENSFDDCVHVLEVYASDCRVRPESREWFNGETNWRKANFDRALGRTVAIPRGSRPVSTRASDESDLSKMLRGFERDARDAGLVDAEGRPVSR